MRLKKGKEVFKKPVYAAEMREGDTAEFLSGMVPSREVHYCVLDMPHRSPGFEKYIILHRGEVIRNKNVVAP